MTTFVSAGFGRRFVASLVDWIICLIVPLIAASAFVSPLWLAVIPLGIIAYFGMLYVRGRTAGMKAASIRVVDQRTARAPGLVKALGRALVSLLETAGIAALCVFALSDRPERGYTLVDFVVFALAALVVLTALIAHLWMFVDKSGRTLLDCFFRLCITH